MFKKNREKSLEESIVVFGWCCIVSKVEVDLLIIFILIMYTFKMFFKNI